MEPEELPTEIPIFPLAGCLLLPGNWLPLNIFEARYRAMVEDALAAAGSGGSAWIGILQPIDPASLYVDVEETAGRHLREGDEPPVYAVGCLGRIERCDPQPDGRFLILLRGAIRFRIRRELERRRGYRRVEIDVAEFRADLAEREAELDPAPVLAAALAWTRERGLEFDHDVLRALPGVALLNGLAAALPFEAVEKQALLEAEVAERERIFLALLGMGDVRFVDEDAPPSSPLVN